MGANFLFAVALVLASVQSWALQGGTIVKSREWREAVGIIWYQGYGRYECSATFVGEHTLVTAAHCALTLSENSTIEVYERGFYAGANVSFKVTHVLIHPNYVPFTKTNPIFILILP